MTPTLGDVSASIVISGGGVVSVATTDLYRLAESLDRVAAEADASIRTLDRIDRAVTRTQIEAAEGPASVWRAESGIADAREILGVISARGQTLAHALRSSAARYGLAADAVDSLGRALASRIGVGVGFLASTVGLLLLPGVVSSLAVGAGLAAAISALAPDQARALSAATREWVGDRANLLSDPAFVTLVRHSVMSVDDAVLGAAKVPAALATLVGDDGLGLIGLATSASLVIGAGGAFGALRETRVEVKAVAPPRPPAVSPPAIPAPPAPVVAPSGLADRASRVPAGSAQVRIDRIQTPRGDRFEVFVGGTIDQSLVSSDEPWDMTSNLTGVAGGDAASVRAVDEAMRLAGVDASTPVVLTGYSQGGLVVATVAASGDYDVRGLVTFGAPAGRIEVASSVPWVALEHTDDLVPAVGGTWAGDDAVVVRRRAIAEGEPQESALPAHRFTEYERTARLADAARESRVEAALGAMNHDSGPANSTPAPVTSTWFEAERAPFGDGRVVGR